MRLDELYEMCQNMTIGEFQNNKELVGIARSMFSEKYEVSNFYKRYYVDMEFKDAKFSEFNGVGRNDNLVFYQYMYWKYYYRPNRFGGEWCDRSDSRSIGRMIKDN